MQSVGFRAFVKHQAEKIGLGGWVSNTPDGRVELLLQGEKEKIEKMILLCRKGPFMAEVKGVSVSWEEVKEEFAAFIILPTGE